jgi:hypothetical protein
MLLAADLKGLSMLALIFLIAVGITVFMIGLSFAAFVLKTSCRIVGADVPDTGKAMVVSFLESLCFGMAYVLTLLLLFFLGKSLGFGTATLAPFAALAVFTLAFVVPAGLYVPMLQVTFPKGLALAVLRYVITFSIFAMVGLAYGAATGKYKVF